jgi:L-malate glycosyltransferase
MKVLFYESRPEWGGAQKCELELIEGLEDFGIETIFVTSTEGPMLDRVRWAGKKVHQIPIHPKIDSIRKEDVKGGLLSKISLSLYLIPHFIKIIKFVIASKADIIYTSQFRSQLLIGWVGKLLGKKVIWHIHGEEKLNNLLGKIAVLTTNHLIVVSKILCEKYRFDYPKIAENFTAIPNGVKVDLKKVRNDSDVVQLIIIGALIEGKRQDLAIKACKKLIDKGFKVHLHIVGEKPHWHSDQYKRELIEIVEINKLQSHITFHGWVEKPYTLLAQSDIFLLPSDTEGLPLSIIEAMGVGLPCIATDVGGVSELIVNEETGLLIPQNSLEELVLSLMRLVENKAKRVDMGKKANDLYEKKYTKRAFLEGVTGVLHTVQK